MEIKLINHGDNGELLLIGRLDSVTADEAEDVFGQVMDRFTSITLNMENLEYVSSAGLRVLKRMHMAMNKKGGKLELVKVRPMVMEVFEMTGFASLLRIV
ncbi:MAG: STAS domain-containing protein [Agathobacter sp.]